MLHPVHCAKCNKVFFRPIGRYNEAIKYNWKQYCSNKCQYEAKNKKLTFCCHRSGCGKTFKRGKSDFLKYRVSYCSHKCFALVSNREHPRWLWKIKKCAYCGKDFRRNKKFCSPKCQHKNQIIDKDLLLKDVKNFVKLKGRIPLRSEFHHYSAVRGSFGTWNNFVKVAGFKPNPVMFAKKHIARDGHSCDSLAEKIVDDWLNSRNIKHERNVYYPGSYRLKVDFKVGDYWIEFFGLTGQHKRYDELSKLKAKLARDFRLKLVPVYPDDLFPNSKLEVVLGSVIKRG